jgi:hypothetical protein
MVRAGAAVSRMKIAPQETEITAKARTEMSFPVLGRFNPPPSNSCFVGRGIILLHPREQ